jgi:hypothetical protein
LTVGWPVRRALALFQRKGTDQAELSPGNSQSVLRCEKRCKLWHRTSTAPPAQFEPGI